MAALLAALFLAVAPPPTNLRIAVWPQGMSGTKRVTTLQCSPPAGGYESPTAVCKRLLAFQVNPFLPVPAGIACSQIIRGPEEALVTGTYRGRRTWARFNRRDSCQDERWSRLSFLFVPSV